MDDKLNIKEMQYKDGALDMSLSGEYAMTFMRTLIDFFKSNGGKNFLTIDLEDKENKYSITIQNCNGVDTPAEKLSRLENVISSIEKYLEESIEYLETLPLTEHGKGSLSGYKVVYKKVKYIKSESQNG